MSKQIWECDYCAEQFGKERQVDEHEKKCSFNPDLKTCWSCTHQKWNYRYNRAYCGAGVPRDEMREIEAKDLACEEYEEKQR